MVGGRAVDIATLSICVLGFVVVALAYPGLPATVPTNFDFSGKATGYGPKDALWLTPGVGLLVSSILLAARALPIRYWNLPVTITAENSDRVLALGRSLITWLAFSVAVTFIMITLACIDSAARGGTSAFFYALLLPPVVITAIVVIYVNRFRTLR